MIIVAICEISFKNKLHKLHLAVVTVSLFSWFSSILLNFARSSAFKYCTNTLYSVAAGRDKEYFQPLRNYGIKVGSTVLLTPYVRRANRLYHQPTRGFSPGCYNHCYKETYRTPLDKAALLLLNAHGQLTQISKLPYLRVTFMTLLSTLRYTHCSLFHPYCHPDKNIL